MDTDHKKAARTAWAYRNFDFLAAVLISARLFALGVGYANHVEAGFEMGYWFWLSALVQTAPVVVLLGVLKAFVRKAVLYYESGGKIRFTASGMVEADESHGRSAAADSAFDAWLTLLRIAFWVFAVFYGVIRVAFSDQFTQIPIRIPDKGVATAFVVSVAMAVRHQSVSYS